MSSFGSNQPILIEMFKREMLKIAKHNGTLHLSEEKALKCAKEVWGSRNRMFKVKQAEISEQVFMITTGGPEGDTPPIYQKKTAHYKKMLFPLMQSLVEMKCDVTMSGSD